LQAAAAAAKKMQEQEAAFRKQVGVVLASQNCLQCTCTMIWRNALVVRLPKLLLLRKHGLRLLLHLLLLKLLPTRRYMRPVAVV
jgi:hypothetical protein